MERKQRVAAYIRIRSGGQSANSAQMQRIHYEQYICGNDDWELAGVYADIGPQSSKVCHSEFKLLMEECKKGKVDLILTKTVCRFSKNLVDAISVMRYLANLKPPVSVVFEVGGSKFIKSR